MTRGHVLLLAAIAQSVTPSLQARLEPDYDHTITLHLQACSTEQWISVYRQRFAREVATLLEDHCWNNASACSLQANQLLTYCQYPSESVAEQRTARAVDEGTVELRVAVMHNPCCTATDHSPYMTKAALSGFFTRVQSELSARLGTRLVSVETPVSAFEAAMRRHCFTVGLGCMAAIAILVRLDLKRRERNSMVKQFIRRQEQRHAASQGNRRASATDNPVSTSISAGEMKRSLQRHARNNLSRRRAQTRGGGAGNTRAFLMFKGFGTADDNNYEW